MEHFRMLLLQTLAMPVPVTSTSPDHGVLMLLASFISQIKVNGMASWVIQKLKDSKAPILGWIGTNTPWVTRAVALAAASLTAVGIHWTYTGSTLMVTGLSLTAIVTVLWNLAQNYLFQHAWYKTVFADPPQLPLGLGNSAVAIGPMAGGIGAASVQPKS
jgi:hypothetical protein